MPNWEQINGLAVAQHGLLSRSQLISLGMSPRTASRLLTDRGWTRVHPGVYKLPGNPSSFRQRVKAAQLALPVTAPATASTAAALYGLRPEGPVVELLVGEHERVRPPTGTRLTRTRTLARRDTAVVAGIDTVTPARMVIDYAGRTVPPEVRSLLIDARQRRLLDLPDVAERVRTLGPVRGRGIVRALVWELDPARCDSVLEMRVRALLCDAGLPPPAPAPVAVRAGGRTLHVDIGWPDRRVGIEADGFAFHSSRADLDRDHRRANALALAGWTLLRVGWGRVEQEPDSFVREIRLLLRKDR